MADAVNLKYRVPREILDNVRDGTFEELTKPGDWARSFGRITGTGYDIRLWVDRADPDKRILPSKERYVVTASMPSGRLLDEVSYANLGLAIGEWLAFVIWASAQGGSKDWSPVKYRTQPGRSRGYFRDKA